MFSTKEFAAALPERMELGIFHSGSFTCSFISIVIPAKAGIQSFFVVRCSMDPSLRRDDRLRFFQFKGGMQSAHGEFGVVFGDEDADFDF